MSAATISRWPLLAWARGEVLTFLRGEFLTPAWRPAVAFALRSCASSVLALYVAFLLQLDEPYWAGLVVWMVAQPTPGMAISKSVYRIIGTIVGSAMGVVLIALFGQNPELFVVGLALWVGACTVASNLLRNFRAYAAVLAGYTAAIVALAVVDYPNEVFDVAMARASATIIGIACATVVTSLTARHDARDKVLRRLREVLSQSAVRAALPLESPLADRLKIGKPLVAELIALDAEIDFAAAESADFRIHARVARSLLAHLFGMLAGRRSLEEHRIRTGEKGNAETEAVLHSALQVLGGAGSRLTRGDGKNLASELVALRDRARRSAPEAAASELPAALPSRVLLDRVEEVLSNFARAVQDWGDIQGGWRKEVSLHLNFHSDRRAAMINGTRAALAILAAGGFWISTAWSSGSSMLIQAAVACSLFSAAAQPDAAGAAFLKGSLWATAAAFVCNFYILQNVAGFPLLALVLSVFLFPGALIFLFPRTSLMGLAYCVNFFAVCRPLNPMNYDLVSFLNNAVAANLGVAFGILAYKLFVPPDPDAARHYVVYRIRRGLQIVAQREPAPPLHAWQTRMFDRVQRLNDPTNPSGTPTDQWFEGGLKALDLGNEVLRLRHLLQEETLPRHSADLLRKVLASFAEFVRSPDSTRFTIQAASAAFQQGAPPADAQGRKTWLRALGSLEEMESFFLEYPTFLKTGETALAA